MLSGIFFVVCFTWKIEDEKCFYVFWMVTLSQKDYVKCDLLFVRGFENGFKYFSLANTSHALLKPFPKMLLSLSLSISLSLSLSLSLSFPMSSSLCLTLLFCIIFYVFPFSPRFLNERERR